MSDPRDEQNQHDKTQRLPPHEGGPPSGEARRTERLAPSGDEWNQTEPVNPGWRKERSGTRRAPKRKGLPNSPQEFQLWMQAGGWRYLAGVAVLFVFLLIGLLAFSRSEQREAGFDFETTAPTVGAPVLSGSNDLEGQPTVTPEPPPAPPRFVVVGTGGQGLFLRSEAHISGIIVATLPEGTVVEQIGSDIAQPDRLWRQVRIPDGREGYVAAEFLTLAP
ncbi:SH3 domain-containing protein [Candidatus Viridilinea mediisalina]|nr:SH3 domain-containing protein [Candidatus Viridilinea mediisalina]